MELSHPIWEINYSEKNMHKSWVTIITKPQKLAFQGGYHHTILLLALHWDLRDTDSDSLACKYQHRVIESLKLVSKNSQKNWSLPRHCFCPIFDTWISKNHAMFTSFRGRTLDIIHSKQWWQVYTSEDIYEAKREMSLSARMRRKISGRFKKYLCKSKDAWI